MKNLKSFPNIKGSKTWKVVKINWKVAVIVENVWKIFKKKLSKKGFWKWDVEKKLLKKVVNN